MTVTELIEALRAMPADLPVAFYADIVRPVTGVAVRRDGGVYVATADDPDCADLPLVVLVTSYAKRDCVQVYVRDEGKG